MCIEDVRLCSHCCRGYFVISLLSGGGSEKKKIGLPENGLKHEHFSLSPVFSSINDLFDEAPSQQLRITSKPYVCSILTPSQKQSCFWSEKKHMGSQS